MKPSNKPKNPAPGFSKGFALIVSLTMLVLLTIIAVGLLSLSAITLRTADQTSAKATAEANARMALMIAIGEIQKQMGPDQRISANADILVPSNAPNARWTGIWDSWIAGPIPDTVSNSYPRNESHHQTIGNQPDESMGPDYQNKDRYFRRWLLSLNPSEVNQITAPSVITLNGEAMPERNSTAVRLVAGGTLGETPDPNDFVSARLIPVQQGTSPSVRGRYGWWIGDESQKANVMDNYSTERPASLAARLNRQQAPASLGNSAIQGLQNVADPSSFAFIPSRKSLSLVRGASNDVSDQFHDITHASFGVLADVREGGLKRDLSTILERDIDPDEVYNFTNVEEFRRATSLKPDGDDFMLYRFDDLIQNTYNGTTGQAAVPIQDLAAYHQLYNSYRSGTMGGIQYSSSESSPSNSLLTNGIMVSSPDHGVTGTDFDKYLRQYTGLYRQPVMVKMEILLGYVSELRPRSEIEAEITAGNPNPDRYRLQIGITPAATFWNPNNVPLVMNLGDPNLYSYRLRDRAMPL